MTDKFPEAFKRFENSPEGQNIGDMRFGDILRQFAIWQNRGVSALQERCLEAEVGIKPLTFRKHIIKRTYKDKVYYQTSYRDNKTGKFTNRMGVYRGKLKRI